MKCGCTDVLTLAAPYHFVETTTIDTPASIPSTTLPVESSSVDEIISYK